MRRTPLFVAGLIVAVATMGMSAPAQADFDLVVTWPANTVVNTANGYTITVSDPGGPDSLKAQWFDGTSTFVEDIPQDGTKALTLHDGVGQFTIFRCHATTCVDTGVSSPVLSVYSGITLDGEVTAPSAGSAASVQLTVGSPVTTGNIAIKWRVFDESDPGTDLASGSRSVPGEGTWAMSLTLPVGLAEGTHQLELTAKADPGDGEVTATVQTPLIIDKTGPEVDASLDFSTFFPAKDNYRDKATVTATSAEAVRYDFWAKTADESFYQQYRHMSARAPGEAAVVPWNGKDNSNTPLPAGDYILEVRAFDAVDNMTVTEFPVTLDLATTKTLTWGARVAPKSRVDTSFVGRCSQLASPSDRGWARSLGLYSGTSCTSTKKRADDVVVTFSKLVPTAVEGRYLSFTVAAWAGQAKGAAGSTAKLTYVAATGAKQGAGRIKGKLGWTDGDTVPGAGMVRDVGGDQVVTWQVGVQKGSQIDVRRFSLTVEYVGLVEPDGTVIAPPA